MLDHGVHHWADSSAKNYLAGALSRPFWVKWEEFGATYCSSYGSCNRDCRIPAKPEGTGHHAALPTTAMTKSGVVLPNLAMPCSCPSPSQGLILCGVYPEPCTRYCSFPKSTAEPVHGSQDNPHAHTSLAFGTLSLIWEVVSLASLPPVLLWGRPVPPEPVTP